MNGRELLQAWRAWLHGGIDEEGPSSDVDEARNFRKAAESDLADALNQGLVVDAAAASLSYQQREVDFTSLVENTFSRRKTLS